jgi:hypothetical protein
MQFRRIFCIGGICVIFSVLSLLLAGGDVWGQCTSRVYGGTGDGSIIMPTATNWIPGSVIGHGFRPDWDNNYMYLTSYQDNECYAPCVIHCNTYNAPSWTYYGVVAATYYYYYPSAACPGLYRAAIFSYSQNGTTVSGTGGNHDWDCDGIPDSQDSDPATPNNPAANNGDPDDCEDDCCESRGNSVGNPTNVATGNKYEEVLDLSISTPGIPLEFRRSYNSQAIEDGPLGYGWTHNFEVGITVYLTTPTKRVIVWDGDGRALYFSQDSRIYSDGIHFVPDSGITKDRLR